MYMAFQCIVALNTFPRHVYIYRLDWERRGQKSIKYDDLGICLTALVNKSEAVAI